MKIAAPIAQAAAAVSSPDWVDVLTDLTGLRLAVMDELLRHGELTVTQVAARLASPEAPARLRAEASREGGVMEALGWLGHHRLAHRAPGGQWRARVLSAARLLFETKGVDPTYTFTPGGSLAAEERGGDRRSQGELESARVETAGGDFFSASRGAPVARVAHVAPARAAVHAPQFFDFGDY